MKTRHGIATTLVALLFVGCSKAVVIPREELSREEYRRVGSYRVKLHGWNEYETRRFSVTDSTVVIEELNMSDDHYKLKRHEMPIVVPLKDVEYVGVMKTNWPVTAVVLATVGTAVGYFVWLLATWDGVSD